MAGSTSQGTARAWNVEMRAPAIAHRAHEPPAKPAVVRVGGLQGRCQLNPATALSDSHKKYQVQIDSTSLDDRYFTTVLAHAAPAFQPGPLLTCLCAEPSGFIT